ncbi:hypothetical protein JOF41_000693 [Saccharothrix coeruleofusca]|uniref:hypothetical protein n=1 Tax=Saccharothrix coeruleofusca TaxID=33919 RepID=UPI001AE3524F|nr:hypothetical protein [Saccharothrix coeruleofusca]MBP2334515.1 hypothetical protein [Saccharothrix coeruleofusca]
MRSLGTAVGAAALLVALVGCATSQPGGDAGAGPTLTTAPSSPSSAPPSEEFESPVPPGGTAVPEARVDATALPEGSPRAVWTEADGSVLGVIGQEAGCGRAGVEVAEQSAQVVKVVLVETLPKDQQVCTMDIRYPPLTAKLDAPLGERSVVLSTRQEQR